MQKLKCRTAYTARDEDRCGLIFADDEGLTQQHFKDECDVNLILKKYMQTGVLDHQSAAEPWYGDVSDIPSDLASSYEQLARAEAAFMSLPSDIRKALDNDPSKLESWIQDENNRPLAEKFGLIMQRNVIENTSDNKVVENVDSKAVE